MANSVQHAANPLSDVYDRLIPSVKGIIPWWQTEVRNWARKKKPLQISLLESVGEDDKIALFAAIYDYHAAPAARINPWREDVDSPHSHDSLQISDSDADSDFDVEGFVRMFGEGWVVYRTLVQQVPSLLQHWESNKAAIEDWLVVVEKRAAEARCLINVGDDAADEPSDTNSLSDVLARASLAMGESGNKVFQIASLDESAESRARKICDVDASYWMWDSEKLASLLGVSGAAIRKTTFWKVDRPRHFEDTRQAWLSAHPDRVLPEELRNLGE